MEGAVFLTQKIWAYFNIQFFQLTIKLISIIFVYGLFGMLQFNVDNFG